MEFQYSDKVKTMRPSIIRELLKQMADPTLISFAGGNPSADAFPVEQIRRISDQLLREEPTATLQYNISEGYPPLIESGTQYLNAQYPIAKDGDEVIITAGSQQVMDFLSKILCNEGDVVATDDPAFLGALNAFRGNGAKLVGVAMEPDGPSLAALEAALSAEPKPKFYYTIPNFQNPTGCTTSLAKRKAILALCQRHGVPILEDNPYGEIRIHSEGLPPIKAFDTEGSVVYAASMSKVFAPGMRVAFCVGPRAITGKMVTAKQGNDVHTNIWGQRVIDKFLRDCDMEAHLARLRDIYTQKADFMCEQFAKRLAGRIEFACPGGGMFIWPTLPPAVNMLDFVGKCLERKLALVPGNAFFVDDEAPCSSVRVNFSTPTLAQIEEGVGIMDEVLAAMGG